MAVSVQTPLYSKPDMWHSGGLPSSFSSESGGIPVSMAYPYSSSGIETSPMIPSYHHPLDHERIDSPNQMNPSSPGNSHGISAGSKAAKIKRSMSTPNVRGQSSAEAAAMALSADKRRNKLGYHRTSVACGEQQLCEALTWTLIFREVKTDSLFRTLSQEEDQMHSSSW